MMYYVPCDGVFFFCVCGRLSFRRFCRFSFRIFQSVSFNKPVLKTENAKSSTLYMPLLTTKKPQQQTNAMSNGNITYK